MAAADQTLMERPFQKLLEAEPDLAAGQAGGTGREESAVG
jgi:hypothetical protein